MNQNSLTNVDRILFHKLNYIFLIYAAIYCAIYFYTGAIEASITSSLACLLITSIILLLDKPNLTTFSQLLFCISSPIYIFFMQYLINASFGIEYYFFATLIMPLLIFKSHQRWQIILSVSVTPISWGLLQWLPLADFAQSLSLTDFPVQEMKIFNFFACNILVFIFLKWLIDKNEHIQEQFENVSQRQEYILEGAGLGSWDWWLESNRVSFDARWSKMIGLELDETPQELSTWDSRVHPEDKVKVYQDIKDYLDGKTSVYENIHRMKHVNGSWVWILDRGRLSEWDVNGKPVRFTGTHFEMSSYKEAEVLLGNIQKMAKIGGWEMDIQYGKTKWTDETFVIQGTQPGASISVEESFSAFLDQAAIKKLLDDCISGKSFRETLPLVDTNKLHRWVEIMGEPVFDSDAKVRMIRGTIQDVTELRKKEIEIHQTLEKLQHSESQLEEAQRVAKIGSWSFNLLTGKISWSKQMYSIFPEDIQKGTPTFEKHLSTIHTEDQDVWKNTVEKCLIDGVPYRFRFRSVFPDRIAWVEAIGQGFSDENGKIIQLSGTCQDVTELVIAENQAMIERAKASHASKLASLGEMSAGIAHEINNPLAIIAGAQYVLKEFSDDPKLFHESINSIEKSTNRIAKIVNGLKKLSRTSEKRAFKPHSLEGIIREAIVLTEPKAKVSSSTIHFECLEDSIVLCDEVEIEQVLINIINNGIDASKMSNEKWVKVELFTDDDSAILHVIDSGKPIPEEVTAKLFQPFFSTKPVGEGTGLGLSISKGILMEHGGSVSLLSNKSQTCFEIRLKKLRGTHVA